jgi:hypothetical protein
VYNKSVTNDSKKYKITPREGIMKYSHRIFMAITMLLILIGLNGPGVLSQEAQPFATMAVSDTIIGGSQRTSTRPGLDSALSQLLDAYEAEGLDAAQSLSEQSTMMVEGDQVQVIVVGESDADMEAIRAVIAGAGGSLQSAYENFQQAMVPIGTLESLTGRADVTLVREPYRPIMLEPEVGAQTTEGVAASLADTWHTHTVPRRGEGVKVAVIDGGFDGYDALLGTDLPAATQVITRDYTSDWPGTSIIHGTACAEIVYDMAYGVDTMYLVKIATDADFASAISYLIGQGVHVISMSLGWTAAGPGDGTDGGGSSSPLYTALTSARSNGIFVATAAGNNRENMWSGTYNDGGGWHDWDGAGQQVNYYGDGTGSAWVIPAGTNLSTSLHWDAWSGTPQDYDLELYYYDGVTPWVYVTGSYNNQTTGAAPQEYIGVTAPVAAPYGYVVWDTSTTRACCIRLITSHTNPDIDERVTSRTLVFPADSLDAMAVAAVDVTSPYPQESYSSEGPRFGPGGTCTGATAVKPDIAAYANVSTVSYGVGGFNGTSAATPHVAGAAVLYMGAYSATWGSGTPPTPAQTQTYLENNATDLGAAGKDTLYGAGRLTLGSLGTNAFSLAGMGVQSSAVPLILVAACVVVGTTTTLWFTRKRRRKIN